MLVKSLAFVGAADAAIRSRVGTHHATVEDYTIGSVDLSNFITSWNYTMVSFLSVNQSGGIAETISTRHAAFFLPCSEHKLLFCADF